MNIKDLTKIQHSFDSEHGWSLDRGTSEELVDMLSQDLIGTLGELGEFSNIVKKANLLKNNKQDLDEFLKSNRDSLEEEVVDTFIYIMRIATHMNIDLEDAYLEKLAKNKKRFSKFGK